MGTYDEAVLPSQLPQPRLPYLKTGTEKNLPEFSYEAACSSESPFRIVTLATKDQNSDLLLHATMQLNSRKFLSIPVTKLTRSMI